MADRSELALINAAKAWHRARQAGDEERVMRATQRLHHMVQVVLDVESLQRQARKAQSLPRGRPRPRLFLLAGGRRT
jgi:hypothetical protein